MGAAIKVDGVGASLLAPLLSGTIQPITNRDRGHLTALIIIPGLIAIGGGWLKSRQAAQA